MKVWVWAIIFGVTAAVGFVGGTYYGRRNDNSLPWDDVLKVQSKEVRLGGYKFINPLLECEYNQVLGGKGFASLKKSLEEYVKHQEDSQKIIDASIYYRDLNSGPWFDVKSDEKFAPASLLKLPVLMAYLKKAEADPSLLEKKFKFEKNEMEGIIQDILPSDSMKLGKEYTVEDLLYRMIVSSDNNALALLQDNITEKEIDKVTKDLDIITPNNTTPEDFMTVRSYSGLFRILYNSSYLNKDMSEKALGILANSEFNKGLVAGIPKGVVTAHKFGERELPDGIKQLHDCGVVYFPTKPYLLCVMTRGTDFNELASTIAQVSQKVYTEVDKRY